MKSNLNIQKDQIIDHIERLLYVVRNAACHQALAKYKNELNQNYWILIFNNFLDIAILEWCKVFGSHSQPSHWKTLVDDQKSFRQDLLTAIEIGQSDWEAYWKDIKDYRDKFLAHHLKDPSRTHYPSLDIALKSSFYYDSWLINKLTKLNIIYVPDDLRTYYDDFLSKASNFSEVACLSTKHIEEKLC